MHHLKNNALSMAVLLLGSFANLHAAAPDTSATGPQAGQKVAFMGDSITAFGAGPTGYVSLVAKALEANGRKIVVIPAGVSGNTSKDMLARLQKDVIAKKPDWMTLSCGVNDVWHGEHGGVLLDQYQKNITSIVDQATAAGIKVVILTATMIHEDQADVLNQKLIPYNDFLRALAAKDHLPIADLNADMQAVVAQQKALAPNLKGNLITVDGVHMNGIGNEMMAAGVLKAFGFTDAQLATAKESWMDMPYAMSTKAFFTVRQYLQLRALAASQGHTVDDMVSQDLTKDLQNNLSATPPGAPAKL